MIEVKYFFYLIVSAAMQAFAMALLKIASSKGQVKTRNGFIRCVAVALFGISFPIYMKGLSALSLGVVQPVYTATMFLTTFVLSAFLLKERIVGRQIFGGFVILFGIIVILQ